MLVTLHDELSVDNSRQPRDMQGATPKNSYPPWKRPTRPCPFYSQGRCLFSNSCSFLHDVKIKVRPASDVQDVHDETRIYGNPPLLTGLTIPSSPSPQSPNRSPNRSPRMTSLLLALRDVIGEDAGTEGGCQQVEVAGEDGDGGSETPEKKVWVKGQDITQHDEELEVGNHARTPVEGVPSGVSWSLAEGVDDASSDRHKEHQLLVSHVNLSSPPHDEDSECSPHREGSIDSGYGDGYQAPPSMRISLSPNRSSALNLFSSPFASPSVRVFYPKLTRGNMFSPPFNSFPSSVSEAAPSPVELHDRLSYFERRHSHDSKVIHPAAAAVLMGKSEDDTSSSPQRDESRSSSSSSLSSLDTLSSPPLDPQTELATPQEASLIGTMTSPLITGGEPALQRPRASSELTVMAPNFDDEPQSPVHQSLEVANMENESLNSIYGLYDSSTSDHLWSLSASTQNFSRPSSTMSFHAPMFSTSSQPSGITDGSSPVPILASPFQEKLSRSGSTVSITRPSSTNSNRRSEESPSFKVPFGFRHSKRRDVTRTFTKPEPLHFSQQPPSALSLQSPTFFDQSSASPRSLRPLRLTTMLSSSALSPGESPPDTSYVPPSPSVLSDDSISNNPLLSSARSSIIPEHVRHTLVPANDLSPLLLSGLEHSHQLSNFASTIVSAPQSPISDQSLQSSVISYRHSPPHVQIGNHKHTSSRLSASIYPLDDNEEDGDDTSDDNNYDETIRNPIGQVLEPAPGAAAAPETSCEVSVRNIDEDTRHSAPVFRTSSIRRVPVPVIDDYMPRTAPTSRIAPAIPPKARVHSVDQAPHTPPTALPRSSVHAIATPRPTLMFAIASDRVEEVESVFKRGEASPNDQVGPQSALEFALMNDQLVNKMEIVKTLLAYGADPSILKRSRSTPRLGDDSRPEGEEHDSFRNELKTKMDPATRYFVSRADAAQTRRTSALIHRSFFRPLTRIRYEVIGQDCAFEQLFRVLSMHSQNLSVAPVVVLLSGPSGHGKSLVARKFGSLLDVPTHTVNMTTLRSTYDLWQSYSMSPYEEPSTLTLAEFLTENEGKRCVVVLDEMDKVVDEKTLWSLLMPWELGRCSFEAGRRHVNVQNVIWLGTTNIGHQLVFEYQSQRNNPDIPMDRQEYVTLVDMFRPDVSKCLGPSLLSRVTTVLPFVPFTQEEKMAIATQALFSLGGEMVRSMSAKGVENLISKALHGYLAPEGARSLYRAVSTQLLNTFDSI